MSESNEQTERRAAKRIAIRLPVVYRGPDGTRRRATTENISRRGMLLIAQEPAAEGTRLRVALTGSDGREREVDAEVVRQGEDGRLGISIAESDAATIEEIVADDRSL